MTALAHATAPAPWVQAAARRAHRAAVARRLLAAAPAAAPALDWSALDRAPAWLALSEASLALLARRVGSVFGAPALRLWIAAPQVAAARAALGVDWWQALLAHEAWPACPEPAPAWPAEVRCDAAGVADLLQRTGTTVLLCTLPHGALRHAASQLLGPGASFTLLIDQAQALLATTLALQAPEREAA